MPYNAEVADRVRSALSDRDQVREVNMFGGLAFMVDERMVVCVSGGGSDLLVRVAPERDAELVTKPGARRAEMGKNRSMGEGWITVDQRALDFNDNADHLDAPPVDGVRATYLVDWWGSVYQALRDISAWAEHGRIPPASTRYEADGAGIVVPHRAAVRRGIQPVVRLSVHGRDRIEVKAGQQVALVGTAQTPPGTGRIVSAAWDFTGTGEYTAARIEKPRERVLITASHRFGEPGTYFVALKVASSRTAVTGQSVQVENLDRIRVIVR